MERIISDALGKYFYHELEDETLICNLRANIQRNARSPEKFQVLTGFWGDEGLTERITGIARSLDYVLLADCFYSKAVFPDLIYTIYKILEANGRVKVIAAIHERK